MPSLNDLTGLPPATAATLDPGTLIPVLTNGAVERLPASELYKVVAGSGEADAAVYAALTLTPPSGSDNVVDFTAVAYGPAGDAASVEYVTGETGTFETVVSVAGNAVTVAGTDSARVLVEGTLSPDAAGYLNYAGNSGDEGLTSFPVYTSDGSQATPETGVWINLYPSAVAEGGAEWSLTTFTDGVEDGQWTTSDAGPTPIGLTFVAAASETGTPTVAAAGTSAQQVIDAITAFTGCPVTAAANGTVTGDIVASPRQWLSGGTAAVSVGSLFTSDGSSLWFNTGTPAAPVWQLVAELTPLGA